MNFLSKQSDDICKSVLCPLSRIVIIKENSLYTIFFSPEVNYKYL